jgi:hypothetical protein
VAQLCASAPFDGVSGSLRVATGSALCCLSGFGGEARPCHGHEHRGPVGGPVRGIALVRVSTGSAAAFSGLPADVVEVLAGAPVQEKVLAELGVAWPDLAGPRPAWPRCYACLW